MKAVLKTPKKIPINIRHNGRTITNEKSPKLASIMGFFFVSRIPY